MAQVSGGRQIIRAAMVLHCFLPLPPSPLQLHREDGSVRDGGTVAYRNVLVTSCFIYDSMQLIDNLGFQFQINSFPGERPLTPQQDPSIRPCVRAHADIFVGDNELNDLCSETSGRGYLHWN